MAGLASLLAMSLMATPSAGRTRETILVRPAAYATQPYPHARRTIVAHNVIDGASPSIRGGVIFGGDADHVSNHNVVRYNVIASSRSYNVSSWWERAVGTGNVARDNCLWGGEGHVSAQPGFRAFRNVSAKPRFIDRQTFDYRLQPGSRCLSVVGYDTAEKLRSRGTTPDEAARPETGALEAALAAPAGADVYRAKGLCPSPVTSGTRVERGSTVPSGPGQFLLQRGGTYSVTPRSHATFGAYGTGPRPRINSQHVAGLGNIRYDRVQVPQVWGGSISSTGPISVTNSRLGGTSISINTTGTVDSGPPWNVACNDVGSAGLGANSDSCILALSPGSTILGNRIAGCGDGTGYGKHGVYAKARDVRMGYNTVRAIGGGANGNGQAFSLRLPGARVDHNVYDGTGAQRSAVDFYGQGTTVGTMIVEDNDFRTVALWLDPYDSEGNPHDWIFRSNRVRPVGGETVFVRGGSSRTDAVWRFRDNDLSGFSVVNSLIACPGVLIRTGNSGTNGGNCD